MGVGSGAWECEVCFDPDSKVELVSEVAELRKLPPNIPSPGFMHLNQIFDVLPPVWSF